jgi:hypothetical protein
MAQQNSETTRFHEDDPRTLLVEVIDRAQMEMANWTNINSSTGVLYEPSLNSIEAYKSARDRIYHADDVSGRQFTSLSQRLAVGGACRQTFNFRKSAMTFELRTRLIAAVAMIKEILEDPRPLPARVELDDQPLTISQAANYAATILARLSIVRDSTYPLGNETREDGSHLRPTHKKSKILSKLPDDWVDLAWDIACQKRNSHDERDGYLPAFAVMIAIGSRPVELTGVVHLKRYGTDIIVGHLSAKGRSDDKPYPRANGIPLSSKVGQYLATMLGDREHIAITPLPPLLRQAFIMWVRRIGTELRAVIKDVYGIEIDMSLGEISSTTYRQQFAANTKATQPLEQVAMAMGHRSALTQQRYAKSTKSKGVYRPTVVQGNAEIRNLDKLGRPERLAAERGVKTKAARATKQVAQVVDTPGAGDPVTDLLNSNKG